VKAQDLIQAAVPRNDVYDLHMLLIRHGREVCLARRPLCSRCPLNAICPRIGVVGAR
jgi:endonuclease III